MRAPSLRVSRWTSAGSPLVAVGIIVAALAVAYLLITYASLDFRIYLIWAAALAVVAVVLGIKYATGRRALWGVVALGLVLKMVGSLARYEVIFRAYDGSADAPGYYERGLAIAQSLWHFDTSPLFYFRDRIWGTEFLDKVSGIVISISGPSMLAAFLLFSLIALAGVFLVASASSRLPGVRPVTYLAWLVMWPSLFFWPSSIGKEAFLMLGLGLAVWGYTHFPRVSSWVALPIGLLALGMVRPHIAAVVMIAMCAGILATTDPRGIAGRWYFQAVFWVGALALTGFLAANALGIESADSAVDLIQGQSRSSAIGGSATAGTGLSPLKVPQAIVNTIFRPYLWEARSPFLLVSALEVVVLLVLVIVRRRQIWAFARDWRSHRLIVFSIVFVVLYAVMLGFSMSNLGIIARQRVLLLPMVLLMLQDRDAKRPID